MKKALLLSMLAMSSFIAADAQSWIGGDVTYSYQKDKNEAEFTNEAEYKNTIKKIGFSPSYHRDINDKWALGLGVGFSLSKRDEKETIYSHTMSVYDEYNTKSQIYSITPYLRHYWISYERFRFFFQYQTFYEYQKDESEVTRRQRYQGYYGYQDPIVAPYSYNYDHTSLTSERNRVGLAVIPGIEYRINERFAICSHIGHLQYNLTWKGDAKSHQFDIGLTSDISLGLLIRLGDI